MLPIVFSSSLHLMNWNMIDIPLNYVYFFFLLLVTELYYSLSLHCYIRLSSCLFAERRHHFYFFSSVCLFDFDFASFHVLRWNSRFNKRILRSHPNVWAFIECLKKEEVVSRQMMLKFTNGDHKKKTKAILALEVRLKTLST